uniref:Uncharacterized protein n=1 Tax=Poecilia mexicana TaxID=48701 RepID=A0A3B3YGB9_9TELE
MGWQTEKQPKHPHNEAGYLSIQRPSQPPRHHGFHQRQVAVDANHDQRVDAGVEIDDNIGVDQFAQSVSVRPVELVQDVHGPERQATQQQEVGQRQVAQVDLRHGQAVPVGCEHGQDEAVEEKPQQRQDEDVGRDDGVDRLPVCGVWSVRRARRDKPAAVLRPGGRRYRQERLHELETKKTQ